MTHEEVLLKLLAVEPETKDGLIRATGWPPQETLTALKALAARRLVVFCSGRQAGGRRYDVGAMYRLRPA